MPPDYRLCGPQASKEYAIPTPTSFFRGTPIDLLRIYLGSIGIEPPAPPTGETAMDDRAYLQTFVEGLENGSRERILRDADRIGIMAKEPGQVALFAVIADADVIEHLPNGSARALWTMLYQPEVFEQAEQVHYADQRRYGRMWDAFICASGREVIRSGEPLGAFKHAVSSQFRTQNVEVELCGRSRNRLSKTDVRLVQAAIYREGRSSERKVFVEGRLGRFADHPVIEAAITYEPASGTIEAVAAERETREVLVRLFAKHLLKTSFEGERMPIRQYSLGILAKSFAFPTDPEDNIEDVRVTSLRLMPIDSQGERITLECFRGTARTVWQMAESRFGEHNPLLSGYSITKAKLVVIFRGKSGKGGGRTLPVTISMPHGCDLKDRTEREQLIGDKYLCRWCLVRDV